MSIKIRLPQINAPSPDGKIMQIKSYFYQLIPELQMTIDNLSDIAEKSWIENEKLRTEANTLKKAISSLEAKIKALESQTINNTEV